MNLTCCSCSEQKSVSEFNKASTTKRGYQRQCRGCSRSYEKKWRKNNMDKIRATAKRGRTRLSEYIRELKSKTPCSDCNVLYPYYVMDFDHIRGDKLFNIAKRAARGIRIVKREISKCDIVCANCHRIRTQNRRS